MVLCWQDTIFIESQLWYQCISKYIDCFTVSLHNPNNSQFPCHYCWAMLYWHHITHYDILMKLITVLPWLPQNQLCVMHDFMHDDEKFSNSIPSDHIQCLTFYVLSCMHFALLCWVPNYYYESCTSWWICVDIPNVYICLFGFKYDEVQVAHFTHWPLEDFKEILEK